MICNNLRNQVLSGAIVAVAATLGLNANVAAQSNVLEEVVVTARRVEENLQEVPISITALTGFQLEDRMIRNMFDLPMIAPGLFTTIGATRGNAAPVFSIRGQANRNIQPGGDSSIGIYFADVPWARPEGANADLFDLESVQVLKGPQGTLFGRNSTGGAILLTPRPPTYEFDGYAEAEMGSYNMRAVEGAVNIPILQDTLALRLGGQYRLRDGYMVMLNTGVKFSDVDAHSLRASLLWTPNEQITSTTVYSYFRSDIIGDGTKVIDITPAPNSGTQAQFYPFAQQALANSQQAGKYEGYSAYTPNIQVFAPFTVANPGNGPLPYIIGRYIDTTANTIQNTTVWEVGELGFLGDVSFKNIMGYRETKAYASSDNTGVPILTVVSFGSAAEIEQVSNEFQVLGTNGALDYVVGAFVFSEYGDALSNTYQFNTNATSQDGWVKNASKSLFAHTTYDLSGLWLEGLKASIGARITEDNRELINRNYQQLADGTFRCRILSTITTATRNPDACSFPTSVSYSEPTWNIGLNYQFTPDNMVYTSLNRGYRSGGLQQGATTAATATSFLPEFVDSYEIGSKNNFQFGSMLGRLNVAVYYTDLIDTQKQINKFVEGAGIVSTLFNATSGSTTGIETEFTLHPMEQLELGLNLSYIDTKFDEYTDLVQGSGGIFYPVDISDSYFPYMSKKSASANATYTLPLDSRFGELSVNGSYAYRSSFITNTDISTANCFSPEDPNRTLYSQCYNRRGLLPSYSIVNLRVNWQDLMGWGVDASFFVENLLNEYYYVYSSASYPNLTVNPAMPGEPRMFGVSIRVPFGAGAY